MNVTPTGSYSNATTSVQRISPSQTSANLFSPQSPLPGMVILRAEIPELGLRKAIRVCLQDRVHDIIRHLLHKSNVEDESFYHYRLFRPFSGTVAAELSRTGATTDRIKSAASGEWLDANISLIRASEYGWHDHDVVQLCAPSPNAAPSNSTTSLTPQNGYQQVQVQHSTSQSRRTSRPSFSAGKKPGLDLAKYPKSKGMPCAPVAAITTEHAVMLTSNEPGPLVVGNEVTKAMKKWAQKSFAGVQRSITGPAASGKRSRSNTQSKLGVNPTFGVPLENVALTAEGVPVVIENALRYLEAHDLKTEGLFRLSGAASMVSKYRECFDQGLDVEFESQQTDAHAVAGLVKLFLREMPEPLLSYDLYDAWVASNNTCSSKLRLHYLYHLLHSLPSLHILLCRRLFSFFLHLTKYGEWNKMTLQNLATVLGPNILRSRDDSAMVIVRHAGAVNTIALELIRYSNELFLDMNAFYALHPDLEPTYYVLFTKAIYPYTPQNNAGSQTQQFPELCLKTNDIVFITSTTPFGDQPSTEEQPSWWVGEVVGGGNGERSTGIVPSNYVSVFWTETLRATPPLTESPMSPPIDTTMTQDCRTDTPPPLVAHPLMDRRRSNSAAAAFVSEAKTEARRPSVANLKEDNETLRATIVKLLAENRQLKTEISYLEGRVETLEFSTKSVANSKSIHSVGVQTAEESVKEQAPVPAETDNHLSEKHVHFGGRSVSDPLQTMRVRDKKRQPLMMLPSSEAPKAESEVSSDSRVASLNSISEPPSPPSSPLHEDGSRQHRASDPVKHSLLKRNSSRRPPPAPPGSSIRSPRPDSVVVTLEEVIRQHPVLERSESLKNVLAEQRRSVQSPSGILETPGGFGMTLAEHNQRQGLQITTQNIQRTSTHRVSPLAKDQHQIARRASFVAAQPSMVCSPLSPDTAVEVAKTLESHVLELNQIEREKSLILSRLAALTASIQTNPSSLVQRQESVKKENGRSDSPAPPPAPLDAVPIPAPGEGPSRFGFNLPPPPKLAPS